MGLLAPGEIKAAPSVLRCSDTSERKGRPDYALALSHKQAFHLIIDQHKQ
jgi:hypothetical protein